MLSLRPSISMLAQQIALLRTYLGMSGICSQRTICKPRVNDSSELHASFKDWYCFLFSPYISQVWLPVPATKCNVMAIITCNYNSVHTSALMARVYSHRLHSQTLTFTHDASRRICGCGYLLVGSPGHEDIKAVPNTVPLSTIDPGPGSEMWFVVLFILGASGKLEST